MAVLAMLWTTAGAVCWAQIQPPVPMAPPHAPAAPIANPARTLHAPPPNVPPSGIVRAAAETEVSEGSVRRLRGSVKLETEDMVLEADAVDYDESTGDALARGHVKFQDFSNGDKLECDHAEYNIDSETGKFYDVKGTSPAKIQSRPGMLTTTNPFYFEGRWAERIEEKYVIHDGFITDCKVPRPWWTLNGPKFDVVPNDRAIAYHAVFRIRRVPLFYLPAYYKSLKKLPRKSGFLTPNIGNSSQRGKMFGVGYYWAINRSYDLLYRVQDFTQRGFAHTADFRGKVRPGTDFSVSLYGVNDRGIKVGGGTFKAPGFSLTGDGRSDLGHGWYARGELNYVSSFLFRQVFTESFHEAVYSQVHSVGYLTKHWSTYAVNIVAERDEDFQSTLPGDNIAIRKLPQFEFNSREHEITIGSLPIYLSLESTAGFLRRTEPLYQTRAFMGRQDFYPKASTAFHWKGFSLVPGFAVRETHWSSSFANNTGTPGASGATGGFNGQVTGQDFVRSAREITVDLIPPSLERVFKAPKFLGIKMKHVIEPRVSYRYVTGVDDFNRIIRFDETELMTDTNELELAITNRLYTKNKDGKVSEVLTWEVMQRRYFDPTFGGAIIPGQSNVVLSSADLTGFTFLDRPRTDSPVVSVLRLQQRVNFEWRADYDPLFSRVVNNTFSVDTRISRYFISLGDTSVRTDPVLFTPSNQLRGLFAIGDQNRKGWNAAFAAYYDYRRSIMQFATTQLTYNTDCCGLSFQFRRFALGARNENQFRVAFAISNVGTFGTLKKQERIF